MKTYKVTIEERAIYTIEVTARSIEGAEKKAEKMFLGANGISIEDGFETNILDRDICAEEISK